MKVLRRTYYTLDFIVYYLRKLVMSNLLVAADILTPGTRTNPGFIEFPLHLKTDWGLLLFSNLVAMTPGTLSIDISQDKSLLLVHLLFVDKQASVKTDLARIHEKIRKMTEG
jgi:multisubunit Na+/H+ antiporter MnhE subunit